MDVGGGILKFHDGYDAKCIELGRLSCAGHVLSMDVIDTAKKV
jgi:hypothetical protein